MKSEERNKIESGIYFEIIIIRRRRKGRTCKNCKLMIIIDGLGISFVHKRNDTEFATVYHLWIYYTPPLRFTITCIYSTTMCCGGFCSFFFCKINNNFLLFKSR